MAKPAATRRQEYAEQTRNALIEAATQRMVEQGYEATSIAQIAADVRVSKGAVYHHFPDKRSLFKAVFSEVTSRSVATVAESMDHMRNSPPDDDDVVGMAIDAALTTALKDREYSVLRQQAAAILSLDERKQIKADSTIPLVIQLHAELHDDAATLQVDLEVATSLILAILGAASEDIAASDDPEKRYAQFRPALIAMAKALVPKADVA